MSGLSFIIDQFSSHFINMRIEKKNIKWVNFVNILIVQCTIICVYSVNSEAFVSTWLCIDYFKVEVQTISEVRKKLESIT
jgi:hypothetical protein